MAASAWAKLAAAAPLTVIVIGCADGGGASRDRAGIRQSGATTQAAGWDATAWRPPEIAALPDDSLGRAVRRGRALFVATRDSLPRFVGSNLNCTSCHLDEGRRVNSAPVSGVFARYPKYLERTGAVISIEERVNYCMTRSLAGSRLPHDSREMQDMVAYFAYISRGVPIGARVAIEGMPQMPPLSGDTVRGGGVYRATCARCHGPDGAGIANAPALWGAKSYSIGASMARLERAASFIRHNMPFDQPGTLTDQEAFDVAAYMNAQARPDLPGKENDWPAGGAPRDVPYATKGREAYQPPPLLPRRDPGAAVVPAPRPVSAGARAR